MKLGSLRSRPQNTREKAPVVADDKGDGKRGPVPANHPRATAIRSALALAEALCLMVIVAGCSSADGDAGPSVSRADLKQAKHDAYERGRVDGYAAGSNAARQ